MSIINSNLDQLFGDEPIKRSSKILPPLAERMRPEYISQVLGQEHLLAGSGPLRKYIEDGDIPSIIFWGPPGSGKTTLAFAIANELNAEFARLSAVDSGVKDVREVLTRAERNLQKNKKTILFIDEIHRFNKAQQDALLHSVENGTIILIGATTENPSFEIIPALISRMQVYKLNPLSSENIRELILRAVKNDEVLSKFEFEFEDINDFYEYSSGDARNALNLLESAFKLARRPNSQQIRITKENLKNAMQKRIPLYDKKGEYHYDTISAFIKSLRGSDPDAAMLWMAKMLEAGEDPLFIARRMVIFASEDIGNAEPTALLVAVAVFQAVQMIGLPEAQINLAQGVTFLASCPKSNASYMALTSAQEIVRNEPNLDPPLYLRNAPTKLMREEGYAKGYKYPHEFENHFVDVNYFPINLPPTQFYFPTSNGREAKIAEHLRKLWKNLKKY
ncbi:MAG: replication-associated recombination protein A [Chloroherpetonaceae bacterium]